MNQSELEANTCNRRQAREKNARASRDRFEFYFWLVERVARDFFNQSESKVKRNQSKHNITFDTQLKTSLVTINDISLKKHSLLLRILSFFSFSRQQWQQKRTNHLNWFYNKRTKIRTWKSWKTKQVTQMWKKMETYRILNHHSVRWPRNGSESSLVYAKISHNLRPRQNRRPWVLHRFKKVAVGQARYQTSPQCWKQRR